MQRIEVALARAGEMVRESFAAEDWAAAALAEAVRLSRIAIADALLAEREPGPSQLRATETSLAYARERREPRQCRETCAPEVEQERDSS